MGYISKKVAAYGQFVLVFFNNFILCQGKQWWSYVDPDATLEQLKKLTAEFLAIFDKCPSKLKKKILQSHNEVSMNT